MTLRRSAVRALALVGLLAAGPVATLAASAAPAANAPPPNTSPPTTSPPNAPPPTPSPANAPPPAPSPPTAARLTPAFDFIALGDMPYGADLLVGNAYRHLIDLVNQTGLPFTLHVGDFKDGVTRCDDAEFALQLSHFMRFSQALIYTPGDNDWLDCRRRGDDPLARLAALRQRFFPSAQSLGQHPVPVQRQADVMPAYAAFVENLRWWHQGVLFATFHTVGPDNGLEGGTAAVRAASQQRELANAAWISAAFDAARRGASPALVLITQAEPLRYPILGKPHWAALRASHSLSVGRTLVPLAAKAPFPVLLIHGDGHQYTVDRPFRDSAGRSITTLWRLEVFGAPRMHAVRVRIQPSADPRQPPFAFTPLWNPLSPDPRKLGHVAP